MITTAALIETATGAIRRVEANVDPDSGTGPGLQWAPLVRETAGVAPGPNAVPAGPPVRTIAERTIDGYVWMAVVETVTLREKTPQEIDEQLTADVTSVADVRLGKMGHLEANGLFRLVNDVRVAAGGAAMTRAQFLSYLRGEAVPGSPAPAAAGQITRDQFIDFLKGL